MSLPEFILGFAFPFFLLAIVAWSSKALLPKWLTRLGAVAGITLGMVVAQIGLLLVARKWSRIESAKDWNELWQSGLDKFLTPTIAADWLPLGFIGLAFLYLVWNAIGPNSLHRSMHLQQTSGQNSKGSGTLIKVGFLVVSLSALAALVFGMLSGSKYISREPDLWKKIAYVSVPALLLWSGWVVAVLGKPHNVKSAADGKSSTKEGARLSNHESKLGWLSALAIVLSATLLILTSGSASFATQAAVAVIVPAALAWGHRTDSATMSLFWLHSATGLIMVLSYFFAETPWYAGIAWFLSSGLLIRFWPTTEQTVGRRWLQAFAIATPALIVAFYSAIQFAIAMSGSTSEY